METHVFHPCVNAMKNMIVENMVDVTVNAVPTQNKHVKWLGGQKIVVTVVIVLLHVVHVTTIQML
jgi:hypothetical protein